MVLWEEKQINVKELGQKLFLDSGTLTPLLKKLEQKGYIERKRSEDDERNLYILCTKEGNDLKKKIVDVPKCVGDCINLSPEEAIELYKLLYKVLGGLK